MISYLSQPIKSTVEPYHENVGLIAQVAQQKQNKYDNVLSTIFQKQNQLLNLDTSQGSEEAEQRKDNLLKQADNQLNKLASSDLTIPDNISQVENIFTPIISDKDVMDAASITAFTKEQASYFDEWKKDGKGLYDAKNEAYFLEQVQKNRKSSLKEVKEKGYSKPVATEFTDIDKWYRESIKELLPNVTMTIAPDGQGRIFSQEGKIVSEDRILKMLPTNAKIIAQAEINAHYDYANVNQNDLLSVQQKSLLSKQSSVKAVMDRNSKEIGYLEDQIKNIEQNTESGQRQVEATAFTKEQLIQQLKDKIQDYRTTNEDYQKTFKEYDDSINEFNSTYKFNGGSFEKQLTEDQLKNLKTSTWLNSRKEQFAEAMSYSQNTIKVDTDQIQLEYIKHKYGLEDKEVDHTYQMIEDAAKDSRDPNKLQYDANGNLVPNTITDPLSAFGDTPANDNTSEVSKYEKGQEFTGLVKSFGEFKANLDLLPDNYISKKKIENSAYDEKMFEQDRQRYLDVLTEWDNNKSLKPTDKLKDSEQTYQDFFKENQDMKDFIVTKDGMTSINNSQVEIVAKIMRYAETRTQGDLHFRPSKKDIIISYNEIVPGSGSSDDPYTGKERLQKQLIIPASISEKYLKGELSEGDYNVIMRANSNKFNWGDDQLLKDVVKKATPVEEIYSKYKSTYDRYKNQKASEYQQGYLTPGVYLKNIIGEKSSGKAINDNTIQYLRTFSDAKFAKDDIDVKYFYRDASSPSGWSVKFTTTGTQINDKGIATKLAPVSDTRHLTNSFVKDTNLNLVGDVSEITKNLNLQKIGDPDSKVQEFLYPYLGKFYKFVQSNEGINVYEKTGDTTFKKLNSNPSTVDQLTKTVIMYREQEINGKR